MTVRKLFDELRLYPEWHVEVKVKSPDENTEYDVLEVTCDDETGSIIIRTKEN